MPTIKGWRHALVMVASIAVMLLVLAGCRVPQGLSSGLPDHAGSVSVGKILSQPFLSPSNGLDGLTVAAIPPSNSAGALYPQPTGGATVSVRFAPEADTRFPEPAFHDWPATNKWLGELTGNRRDGQSFLSRYPGLNGIILRVATYGADTGTGPGTLISGPSVDVLAFPIDGTRVGSVLGGSIVTVEGAAEGWAHVKTVDGLDGFVPLASFAQLPPPDRKNTHDVTLTLYNESDMTVVRTVTINASAMHDNSHLTFAFDPIADSNGQHYRFVLSSPDSTPGNAVTFRYQPTTTFADGRRYEGNQEVPGALVFRPSFAESTPLYKADLDSFAWSSLTNAFVGAFAVKAETADRFLSVDLMPGTRTLNVYWSLIRPAGGDPIIVDGNSQSPGGGLVFNVRYRVNISITGMMVDSARNIWHQARVDPLFFGLYLFVIAGVVTCGGWLGIRWWLNGR